MNKNQIFKNGSTTYYFSSIFFPKKIRDDVFTLYAFVRIADDYVDRTPQDEQGFYDFKSKTLRALDGDLSGDSIIGDFVRLAKDKNFDKAWIKGFLDSMEADLSVRRYDTYEDVKKYIYGSADVIGYMMASIMDLPKESFFAAAKLGESMQLINFIRDIKEDISLGRVYMPNADLAKYGLTEHIEKHKDSPHFVDFVRYEIDRYRNIMKEAEKGFSYIPPRLRASVMTANDMYKWTADKIYANPKIIFEKKVKPSPLFVVIRYFFNLTRCYL